MRLAMNNYVNIEKNRNPKAINKSWTKSWLPNYTFKWYK